MPKHIWTVLCRKGLIESESNLISLLDVFEKIDVVIEKQQNSPKIPTGGGILLPFEVELVSFFEAAKSEEVVATAEFISPAGEIILSQEYPLKADSDSKRIRSKLRLPNLPIKENGTYYFQVSTKSMNDETSLIVATIPLDVTVTIK